MLHQSLVSPEMISDTPGSQSSPQLHIVIHLQLFGVVVSGSATNTVICFCSLFKPDSCSVFPRAKGQEPARKLIDERHGLSDMSDSEESVIPILLKFKFAHLLQEQRQKVGIIKLQNFSYFLRYPSNYK